MEWWEHTERDKYFYLYFCCFSIISFSKQILSLSPSFPATSGKMKIFLLVKSRENHFVHVNVIRQFRFPIPYTIPQWHFHWALMTTGDYTLWMEMYIECRGKFRCFKLTQNIKNMSKTSYHSVCHGMRKTILL